MNTDGVIGQFPWVTPEFNLEAIIDLAWLFQAVRHARVLRQGHLQVLRLHIDMVWKLINASRSQG